MKRYKILLYILSLTLINNSIIPIFADNENSIGSIKEDISNEIVIGQDITQIQKSEYSEAIDGINSANIYATIASIYDVTIPKVLILDGKDKFGKYSIKVSGDIAGNESIIVIPDETFTMKQFGKQDITATILQDKTDWTYNQFDTIAVGTVTADGLTAGSWNGSFNFNISKKLIAGVQEPEQIQYTEFELTADNYEMIGITREGDVIIPETFEYNGNYYKVTSIGENAFLNCSDITSINIPNSVTNISNQAFWGCENITEIEIPKNVTYIGKHAFFNCSNLRSIEIPYGITSIELDTFYNCKNLTNVIIPESVTSINNYAFCYCENLENITIPNNVTTIGTGAFYGCGKLTNINIPNNTSSIGDLAFYCVPHITYNGTATGSPWGAISIN